MNDQNQNQNKNMNKSFKKKYKKDTYDITKKKQNKKK